MDEGVAIILAALFAIAGIHFTNRQNRHLTRKQHTYRVLEKLNDWPAFDQHLKFARELIKSKRVPTTCDDESRKADCDQVDFLLDYYEFLSSAIMSGDVDEALVRRVEEARLCRIYLKFIAYVEANRIEANSILIWENLEFVCYRWSSPETGPIERAIERLLGRPRYKDFQKRRPEIHAWLVSRSLAEK